MPSTLAALLAVAMNAGGGAAGAAAPLVRPALLFSVAQDAAITRAFRAVLNRDPSGFEMRRYRTLMQREGWSEYDIRRDLRERTDYRPYRSLRGVNADDIVRRAYQDILGREPDDDGLRNYRNKIVNDGWSERDVRQALRESDEYAATGGRAVGFRTASADRIIRRAYQDVLGREPDAAGLRNYRRLILQEGWDEQDVRQALIRSPERRQKRLGGMSSPEAQDIVRRAYRSVLEREPDQNGLSHYTSKILAERWTEDDVIQALRDSDEYREKHR
jgi:TorA maturation chaperone TorD